MITVAEAALKYKVSKAHIYNLFKQGLINGVRELPKIMVEDDEILKKQINRIIPARNIKLSIMRSHKKAHISKRIGDSQWLTVLEASKFSGMTKAQIHNLINQNLILAKKEKKITLVLKTHLFLAKKKGGIRVLKDILFVNEVHENNPDTSCLLLADASQKYNLSISFILYLLKTGRINGWMVLKRQKNAKSWIYESSLKQYLKDRRKYGKNVDKQSF